MSIRLKYIELNTIPIPLLKPTLANFRAALKNWTQCGEEKSGMPPTTVLWLNRGDTLVAEHIFARNAPTVRFVHRDLNYMFETYVCYGGPTTTLLKAFQKPDKDLYNSAHLQTIVTGQQLPGVPAGLTKKQEEELPETLIVRTAWED